MKFLFPELLQGNKRQQSGYGLISEYIRNVCGNTELMVVIYYIKYTII